MLYWILEKMELPWLMAPLMLESLVLVAVVVYAVLRRRGSSRRGSMPGGTQAVSAKTGVAPARGGVVAAPPASESGSASEGQIRVIRAIETTAPLFGLLGTVVGLSLAFGQTGGFGSSDAIGRALATQLYTTAFGILIALAAHFAVLGLWSDRDVHAATLERGDA